MFWQGHPCDVCISEDGDSTPKIGATYCNICGKWFCPRCKYSRRRMVAFAKHVGGVVGEFILKTWGKAA